MTTRGPETADLLLRDAPVYRAGGWDGDAVAVRGGRIVGVGPAVELTDRVGPNTRVESLEGRWLLPAFHDAHVHPVQAGLEMNLCDLTGESTVAGYLERVRRYADANPDRAWITGGGWSMDSFPGGVPSADLLDRVCPDRPVYLPNRDHHSAWVNSRALELAGIDRDTPDPTDGRIERAADRRPTGALHEGAMSLVQALTPVPTERELLAGLLAAQQHLHSLGIVGWQDALVGRGLGMPDTLDTYIAAHEQGLLTGRVVLAQWWDRARGPEQLPELLERRQRATLAGVAASSVKIMQDGVCETYTAAMLKPYLDEHGHGTDNRGLAFIDAADLADYVTALDAEDFQVHVHALGDRAVRDSLDAVQRARQVNGPRGNRHHLAHIQVVDPADVARFAQLEVIANGQPLWACRDGQMEVLTVPFLPEGAADQQYVFASLLRSGATLAFGSDWPVSSANPLWGMHVAVNRRAPDAPAGTDPLLPEQSLTVVEALAGYTSGAAFVNRLEDSTGRIEVGYAADLVAVDRDVLSSDPAALAQTQVTGTFVAGREVYRR
ncbi:MAG: hypothetical protein QOK15_815 [Nocardioidaceae bacterium]|jgi:predicted amidohydrolase YtcJ|nr:hypothetical protein [Nocardioidaceae bacterium]